MNLKNIKSIALLSFIFIMMGCSSTKKVVKGEPIEERNLEPIVVTAPKEVEDQIEEKVYTLPNYNETYRRTHDLLHTKLDVKFNFAKQHLLGKAELELTPLFYASNKLRLDAKGFDIHSIKLNGRDLKYDYDGEQILIQLNKEYRKGEKYRLTIDYTAKPNERKAGGSAAITSDKGLFFINPLGEEVGKPTQIWTQGQTESNSAWFPTIDKPNERCTQEMNITVDSKYKVLSNGRKTGETKNSDGTTSHGFIMDKPHAPYLFMMAIGDFAVVEDVWKSIPLEYWVEPDYRPYAKDIFSNTPEMLTFFSSLLGVDYPWSKYSQVIIRDYVSGAMENTTAVTFQESFQKTKRELIDNHNETIIAHEMMHHWFGDLVTCESWSNLTLNEGFANYSEYLWLEHKYGRETADRHRVNEVNGYLQSSLQGGKHPLIHFGYNDKEEMFDAHSYNKGGAILHMLRNFLGDKAFFEGLKLYLERHQFTSVEAHDLRIAFEDITGMDLNWFFNQWFFDQGHPKVDISHQYDETKKEVVLTIEQIQNPDENPPIFIMPLAIDIYESSGQKPRREEITVNQRKQVFTFKVNQKPKLVNVDADRIMLWEKNVNQDEAANIFQYKNAPLLEDRLEALDALKSKSSAESRATFVTALNDKFWSIRRLALNEVSTNDTQTLDNIALLAKNDKHSRVRATAIEKLGETGLKDYLSIAKNAINPKEAYPIVSAGLKSLSKLDKTSAINYAKKLDKEKNGGILNTISGIYAESGDAANLPFFENNLATMNGFELFGFFDNYSKLLPNGDDSTIGKGIEILNKMAIDQSGTPWWKRYAATKALNDVRTKLKTAEGKATLIQSISTIINGIKKVETNPRLKQLYNTF